MAADAPADPGFRYALGIANRDPLVLEGQVPRRLRARIEVLVIPHVRRCNQRARLPVVTRRRLPLRPHQRIAFPGKKDDVRAWAVGVGFLVRRNRHLGNVAVERTLRHVEADVPSPGAPFLRFHEWQVHRIRDKVGFQQKAAEVAFRRKVVGFTGETAFEVHGRVEYEFGFFEDVHDRRQVRDRDEPYRFPTRAVEMLVPGVHRNGEQRSRLPLERGTLPGVVPDHGGPAPGKNHDHLFVELALLGQLAAGFDLADIAVIGRSRGVVVDVDGAAVASRPWLQFDGIQVRDKDPVDDVESFVPDPARVWRVFFLRELLRHVV